MAPAAGAALRSDRSRPRRRGAALRAGDLRGAEGLPSCRRLHLVVPTRGERRPHAALGEADGAARAAHRVLRGVAEAAHRRGRRLGADRARDLPLPPPVHVREGGVPRCAPGREGQLLRDREPGGRLLHRRSRARVDLAVHHLLARGQGRNRRREDRRQLRRVARCPGRGESSTAASRCCSSTRSRAPTSRSSAA